MVTACDAFGLAISAQRPETVDRLISFQQDWISHGPRVRCVLEAADADESCSFVNAQAAAVSMALESAQGFKSARKYLVRARKSARNTSEREAMFGGAIYAWWRGNTVEALREMRNVVEQWPVDLAAAKWAQYLAFNLGDVDAMVSTANVSAGANPISAPAVGMQAFAMAESGRVDEAEAFASRALELDAQDAWSQHALAHVLWSQRKTDEGIDFLERCSPDWRNKSVFIREHNYWHLALFHLRAEAPQAALRVFDDELWGTCSDNAQEQLGAISLLWNLDLLGVDCVSRWAAVSQTVETRWHEHILPYNDVHYVYALARTNRWKQVDSFLTSMERRGQSDDTGIWESVALPVARGLAAFASRRFEAAHQLIIPVLPRLRLIGGSNVQRDLIVRTAQSASAHLTNRARHSEMRAEFAA